jgi:hypothetical protein
MPKNRRKSAPFALRVDLSGGAMRNFEACDSLVHLAHDHRPDPARVVKCP